MKIRTICIIAAVTWLVPIGGCGTDSAQRLELAERGLAVVTEQSAVLEERLVAIDAFLATSQTALTEPNLTDDLAATIAVEIERTREELARVRPAKAKLDRVAAELQTKIATLRGGGDVDVTDELALVAALLGSTGTAIGGETRRWLQVAAAILTGLVTLLGTALKVQTDRKLAAETDADRHRVALAEVVAGGEAFKKAADVLPTEAATVLFKKAQSQAQKTPATQELVAVARTKA